MHFNKYQRLFIENKTSHPANLIPEHPLDFVTHSFPAGGAEMDCYSVGGFADFFHKRGTSVLPHRQRNRPIYVADISILFFVHITPFALKPSIIK
jgi:hypothetical protein